jgi:hypothetical protein
MVLSPKTAGHRWLLAKRLAMPAMCGLLDRTKYEGMHGEVIQEAHKFAAAVAPEDIDGHLFSLENSTERAVLQGDQRITAVIEEMWAVVDVNKAEDALTQPSFMQWSMALHKALIPAVTEKEAAFSAQQDWAKYSNGHGSLDYGMFLSAVFQLADTWVEKIDGAEYVSFLRKLLGAISSSNQPVYMAGSWRSFDNIKCLVNPEVETEDEAAMEIIDALIEVFPSKEETVAQSELSRRGSTEIVQSQIARWSSKLVKWSKSFFFNSESEGNWGGKQKRDRKKSGTVRTGGIMSRQHNALRRSGGVETSTADRNAGSRLANNGRRDSRGPSHFHKTEEYRGQQHQGSGRRRGRGERARGQDPHTLPRLRSVHRGDTEESSPAQQPTSSSLFLALPQIGGGGHTSRRQPSSWQQEGDRYFASTPATMTSASGTSAVAWHSAVSGSLPDKDNGGMEKTPRQRLQEQQQKKAKAAKRLRKQHQKRLQQRATRLIRSFPATDAKRRAELEMQRKRGMYDVSQW